MLQRKKIPKKIVDEIIENSMNRCCICSEIGIQIHHMDGNRNNNNIENLCPLCPNHHSIIHKKGGNTRDYDLNSLKKIREKFYDRIYFSRFRFIPKKKTNSGEVHQGFLWKELFTHSLWVRKVSKGIEFSSKFLMPKNLINDKKILFDSSRLFFECWDGYWIIKLLQEKDFKKADDKIMEIIIYRIIGGFSRFYVDENYEALIPVDFQKESDLKKFKKNGLKKIKKKIIFDVKKIKKWKKPSIKVKELKIYESLHSKVILFIFTVKKEEINKGRVILRLDILKNKTLI